MIVVTFGEKGNNQTGMNPKKKRKKRLALVSFFEILGIQLNMKKPICHEIDSPPHMKKPMT
jgi:hypothetical protein